MLAEIWNLRPGWRELWLRVSFSRRAPVTQRHLQAEIDLAPIISGEWGEGDTVRPRFETALTLR